jgi:hypothetical protein
MLENFLRPPIGPAAWVADAVRLLGAVSAVVAGFGWGTVAFWVTALSLLGVCASRFLALRPAVDIALGLTLLVASWSSVLGLYASVPWLDLTVHFAATGLLAAALYVTAVRASIVPTRTPRVATAVVTASFGVSAAVLWEIAEWVGHNLVDPSIFVSYDDTIGDLVAGAVGSVLAGCAMGFLGVTARAPVDHGAPL